VNQLTVVAQLVEKSVLRYTPAGIPIATVALKHDSKQMHAGAERLVEFEINAIAAGEISSQMLEIELGEFREFKGFLARKNRNSKSIVFHVTHIEALKNETHLLD